MPRCPVARFIPVIPLPVLLLLLVLAPRTEAGGKVGLYGIRMVPENSNARRFSDDAWGGGLHVVVPAPQVSDILAGTAGFEYVNLMSAETTLRDPDTFLRVIQSTSQEFVRLYVGGQVGSHSRGFLRPHAGMNVALVSYGISGTLTIPNDAIGGEDIVQSLGSEHKIRFGYDATLGVDLNFENAISLDGGIRYVKSFGVPQQLGPGSVKIHPDYIQYYLGIGVSFGLIEKSSRKAEKDKVHVIEVGEKAAYIPRTNAGDIQVLLQDPDRPFVEVALIDTEGDRDVALEDLKKRAAAMGGDAIILQHMGVETEIDSIDPDTGKVRNRKTTVVEAVVIRFER